MPLSTRQVLALVALSTTVTHCGASQRRTPAPIGSPQTLAVNFASPACSATSRAPSAGEVLSGIAPNAEARRFYRLTGCFPVALREGTCDWACVLGYHGWCGNDAGATMLALVADGRVVGLTSVGGRADDLIRRDFRIDAEPAGPRLTVRLVNPRTPPGEESTSGYVESYRLAHGQLELLSSTLGTTAGSRRVRGDLVDGLERARR